MRDELKDEEYFKKCIQNNVNSINKLINKLDSKEVPFDRVPIVKQSIAYSFFSKLNAKYSIGENPNNLINDLSICIDLMNESWVNNSAKVNIDGEDEYLDQYYASTYVQMLQILSLGYLLNIADKDFQKLVKIIDRDNVCDKLFEFIIKKKSTDRKQKCPEQYDSKLSVILKVYDKLRKATMLTEKAEAAKLIKQFLENDWSQLLIKYDCITGPKESKYNLYSGLWCFEAAAVVKIMGLDDSSFIDNQYYPKDLVHQSTNETLPKKKGLLGRLGF